MVITDNVGFEFVNQSQSSGNLTVSAIYAFRSSQASGTNAWCLYSSGTAASAHTGKFRLGDTTAPTELLELSAGNLYIAGGSSTGYVDIGEYATTTDAGAPADNRARVYVRDNGAGKEQLCVRFNTGAVQVLATEP